MNAPQYYQPFNYGPPPPPPKKKAGKIVAALVAVVVLAAGITAVIVLRSSDDPKATPTTTPVEDVRPPERNVLVQRIEEGPVTYGTTPAFDACAVLPRAGLADLGFPEDTTDYREAAYLPTSLTPDRATLSKVHDLDPLTDCGYWIRTGDRDDAYITLAIAQLPFNSMPSRRPGETPRSSGLDVVAEHEDDQFFAEIGNVDSRFAATLIMGRITGDVAGVPVATVFGKLTDLVAAALAKGPSSHSSYAFTGGYEALPFACDVLTAELFTELTGKPDSGRVEVDDTSAHETARDYHGIGRLPAIEQQCTRSSSDRFSTSRDASRILTVTFETFRTDAQAKSAHSYQCDPDNPAGAILGEPVPVDQEIGDAKPCVRPIEYLNYTFLIGRTSVRLRPNESWAGTDPDDFGREFAPVAKKLAEEVRERF